MRSSSVLLSGAALALSLVPAANVFASTYGSGTYGNCPYQTNCLTPTPPATPPSNPSTSNPSGESNGQNPQEYTPPPAPHNPHFEVVPANIRDGQVIHSERVPIKISINELTDNGSVPLTSDIGWVSVYVDNKLVGTAYKPDKDGFFTIIWNTLRNPGSMLAIVAYDENGAPVARKDLKVLLDLPENLTTAQPQPVEGEPSTVAKILRSIPPVVVYTFPYWLFLMLLALALSYLYQTAREAVATERMRKLLQRQQLIAEEKDNFIALGSHYLHTPLTVMRNGADTVAAIKEAPETVTGPLLSALERLKSRIDEILGKVESNEILKDIKQPDPIQLSGSIMTTPAYWMPVAAVAGIVIVMNTLLGLVGKWDFGIRNLTTQFIVGAVVMAFLFLVMRTYRLRKSEKKKLDQLVEYENAIDTARTNFIDESTTALRDGLAEVEVAKAALPQTPTANFVSEGYNRFAEILSRFDLLRQIRAGADYGAAEKIDLQTSLNTILTEYQPLILSKNITVHANASGATATGSPALLSYVLRTVIDNAIKFTPENGEIVIGASKQSGKVGISISDNGIGIPADKLPTLFKPFSRAGSALQFDYEGLGFSLFLDRIIMDYMNGDIEVATREPQGTMVTITA